MKNNKDEIDELIHQALSAEEAEFYDQLEEPNLMKEALGLYTGKHKFLSIIVTIVTFLYMGFGVYCAVQFFGATETKQLIIWSGGFFVSLMAVGTMKIWSWMQMDKNALMREIKRLELQVAVLSKKESVRT